MVSGLNRSSLYYRPAGPSAEEITLKHALNVRSESYRPGNKEGAGILGILPPRPKAAKWENSSRCPASPRCDTGYLSPITLATHSLA